MVSFLHIFSDGSFIFIALIWSEKEHCCIHMYMVCVYKVRCPIILPIPLKQNLPWNLGHRFPGQTSLILLARSWGLGMHEIANFYGSWDLTSTAYGCIARVLNYQVIFIIIIQPCRTCCDC